MDLLEFVQDIDSREWIEYKNIEKITIIFIYYLQLIASATAEEEVQVCKDLRQIAKVYSKTPRHFILKIQKYKILHVLSDFAAPNLDKVKYWISQIFEIISLLSGNTLEKHVGSRSTKEISVKERILEYQYEDEYDDSYDYQDSFLNFDKTLDNLQDTKEEEKDEKDEKEKKKNSSFSSEKNHNRKNGHQRKLQKGMGASNF